MGLGFGEERVQKRGCNRKKKDVHIVLFGFGKIKDPKGSRKLDETWIFKSLSVLEIGWWGPKKVAWIDVSDDDDANIMRHRLSPRSFWSLPTTACVSKCRGTCTETTQICQRDMKHFGAFRESQPQTGGRIVPSNRALNKHPHSSWFGFLIVRYSFFCEVQYKDLSFLVSLFSSSGSFWEVRTTWMIPFRCSSFEIETFYAKL